MSPLLSLSFPKYFSERVWILKLFFLAAPYSYLLYWAPVGVVVWKIIILQYLKSSISPWLYGGGSSLLKWNRKAREGWRRKNILLLAEIKKLAKSFPLQYRLLLWRKLCLYFTMIIFPLPLIEPQEGPLQIFLMKIMFLEVKPMKV